MDMQAEALQRIMQYCAEKERCTFDVTHKLEEWEVPPAVVDSMLQKLREEKFLDDTRYVKNYVAEKWNLDRWGKLKIQQSLLRKNLNEDLITSELDSINEPEYKRGLHQLLEKKYNKVKSGKFADDAKRIMMFATGRGFEEDLILEWLDNLHHETES